MSSSLFITGEAKAPSNNPITSQYGLFYIAFVIDEDTGQILDAECSATLELTKKFVRDLFVGERVIEEGLLSERIAARYHGSSQRALVTAFKNAVGKYRSISDLSSDGFK